MRMKKALAVLSATLMLGAMASCGKDTSGTAAVKSDSGESSEAVTTVAEESSEAETTAADSADESSVEEKKEPPTRDVGGAFCLRRRMRRTAAPGTCRRYSFTSAPRGR